MPIRKIEETCPPGRLRLQSMPDTPNRAFGARVFRGVRPGYGGHRKRVRGDGILLAGRSGKERAFDEFIGFE